jgi:phosphotransferase system enzyme I (PtsI)
MQDVRQVLSGIAASPGVAVGRVSVFEKGHVYVPRRYVAREQIAEEEARLHSAVEASRGQLEEIRHRLGEGNEHRLLLDVQLLMHRDELLIDGAIALLHERSINAEWALAQTIAKIAERMRGATEAYFRERAADIENVGERILEQLTGSVAVLPDVGPDRVIVADDLGPADALALLRSTACGIAIDLGSASSHTAILARALDIPAVVGVRGLTRLVADDELVIVDAFRGEVIVRPTEEEQALALARGTRYREFTRGLRGRASHAPRATDGTEIRLDANIELPPEAALAMQEGASGIGLYRTEFLYLDRSEPPGEVEQTRVYTDVVQVIAPRPVVFRTFDIGGDKLHTHARAADCVNPALGMRAIRLGLERPELLLTQLRAILRASMFGAVRVMFPLVTQLSELRRGRELLAQARAELAAEGVHAGEIEVGCMIEVPAAVLMADVLAAECDFFSVGTNDLVQYTLAVDRSNPSVAHLASALHPAVLRLLDMTVSAAERARIDVAMCGGMAADLFALPLVLGYGFRQLSVDLSGLPLVRAAIERVDLKLAADTSRAALALRSVEEVQSLILDRFEGSLGELWAEQGVRLPDGSGS